MSSCIVFFRSSVILLFLFRIIVQTSYNGQQTIEFVPFGFFSYLNMLKNSLLSHRVFPFFMFIYYCVTRYDH